jgi:iron complex outermembrane receptor protein
VDHYRLPDSFEPSPNNPQEKGDRLWSDSTDLKLTLLAGLTPIEPRDVSLTYVFQDSNKGFSPPDVSGRDYYIWEWPVFDRWSVSLNGSWTKEAYFVNALTYYDKYDNRMDEYFSWSSYLLGNHQAHSDYDEYSLGAHIDGGWNINSWNKLRAALTWRKDDHLGYRGERKEVHVNEDTWSAGLEYSINPLRPLTLTGGIGFDAIVPQDFWGLTNELIQQLGVGYYLVQTEMMGLLSWQGGAFWDITADHQLRLTSARRNHFPTMSQRYSTRFGSVRPNPGLGPEFANHFELGYTGVLFHSLNLSIAVYYSDVLGKIVTIKIPNPDMPSTTMNYTINIDRTAMYGAELGLSFSPNEYFSGGGSFALNKYDIKQSEASAVTLPYYPEITTNVYMEIKPVPNFSFIPIVEYTGSRYVDTAQGTELEGYFLAHFKISADIGRFISVSAGVENLFDTYYEIRQNAPLAGRSFTASLTVRY